MQTISMWKPGMEHLFKADANRVANEIADIGENATPKQIVEKARDESTELHKCFDWNDTTAAEKWRIQQARQVVCCLVIKQVDDRTNETPIRTFYMPDMQRDKGYRATELIIRDKDEYQRLLDRAMGELHAFKTKYSMLTELEEIFALIS